MVDDFYIFINENWADTTIKGSVLILNRNLLPYISDELLPFDFDIDQAREIIYRVYNRGAQEQARLLRSIIMSLFKFAIDFDNSPEQYKKPDVYGVKINPVRDIAFKTPENVCDRWLDEEEIYKLWHATNIPLQTHNFLKLSLCLAGQRVMELYHSKAEEFIFDEEIGNTFTIPKSRVKIKRRGEHLIPISHLAEPIIKSLILNLGTTGYLFPHRDKADEPAHISTLRMATQRWCKNNNFKLFTPRDMRRTCKTLMGKAGISKIERDILQQRDKGDVSTLHYDRYDYIKEKK
ncbi:MULTISPECIES: site-specific integrase [unclassified Pseudoalteromonas]|uniref:site-specific integrase n=1 Tax=unclassified Pseudoalteromonas TaxID=194690 RepID=UPI000694E6D9|nr:MULTISPECIES: site-specific integrase [unclassified Pseudoalteromonas]